MTTVRSDRAAAPSPEGRTPDCASYRAPYLGLPELEADTHQHVNKESNVLFPAVLAAEEALLGRP